MKQRNNPSEEQDFWMEEDLQQKRREHRKLQKKNRKLDRDELFEKRWN